jgi:glycosyltransferase involved in cell wall biosynthesis
MVKKKILFPFCGETVGGSHISSVTLIKGLNDDYDIRILVNSKKTIIDFLNLHNLKYNYINYPSYNPTSIKIFLFFQIIFSFFKIIPFLIKIKPHYIHINDIRTLITWLPIIFFLKKKIIYHNRNPLPESKILFFFLKNIKVITISNYLSKKIKIKSKMIYNPITISNLKSYSFIKNNIIKIGFFSNFSDKKKPDNFVKIASHISVYNNYKFIMMGRYNKKEFEKITNLIKVLKLNKKILIKDFSNNHYEEMAKCDYIIATSIDESFGRIPLEANLLKVPIIASYSGGHKETIINYITGYLEEKNNLKRFAERIIFLERYPNIKKYIISNGYNHVVKKFSTSNHVNKIKEFYNE